ncbi:uncharacterized protein [Fopius arisanus]|uniref:Matrix-remodeling-associated protein 7 helical domain-containing protein n=1 Tax=Fopius arisanus TaxID=64838 RepID=A0A9R1T5F1_9HYME|nr:PREDICTED: uncharacterized protein LOC105266539 [Fopius arisanus]
MIDSFWDQWNRYFPNLSTFYIYCVATTVLVVFTTYIFTRTTEQKQKDAEIEEVKEFGIQARYKLAKQKVVQQQLTPEQQLEEKRSESESLAEIYKLLRNRRDVFPDATMEDIRDQLSLYKSTE